MAASDGSGELERVFAVGEGESKLTDRGIELAEILQRPGLLAAVAGGPRQGQGLAVGVERLLGLAHQAVGVSEIDQSKRALGSVGNAQGRKALQRPAQRIDRLLRLSQKMVDVT